MEKVFNWISIMAALIGGAIVNFLGGYDTMLKAIVFLVVLDYITGVIKGIYLKELSSEIGFRGILKKVTIFIVIAVGVCVQELVGDAIPVRETVIMFFVCNEGLSLLENAAVLTPIPEKLKDILLQLRDRED